jgi:catechol 2,3-dioxygenase
MTLPYGISPAGYRLPDATRPGRVRLQVADLVRSLDWYGRVLGLRVLERSGGENAGGARAVLGVGGIVGSGGVGLVELHEQAGAARAQDRARLGLFHFAVLLPERVWLGRFVRHLAELDEAAGASDHRVSEALYLRDPDGLGVEVYADRPRDSWHSTQAREIEMTTEPLNVDDLARAGAGLAWQGVPHGTVIGHVHLHVGDLPEAEAFYHDALGLDKTVWSYPGALFLAAGGYHHHLGLNTWAGSAPPPAEDEARLLEWELLVPALGDATGALESLAHAGHEVRSASDGGTATDPWGTVVRLRAERPSREDPS